MKRLLFTLSTFFILNSPFSIPESHAVGVIQLPATGQTTCWDASGIVIDCAGTGQDGAIQAGAAWPNPRFTDNNNGTLTDNLTGLIWLQNANCTDSAGGITKTTLSLSWFDAISWSNNLASGICGLSDGSSAGQWRLPNRKELLSLINYQSGCNSCWLYTQGFNNGVTADLNGYWSSSSWGATYAWAVVLNTGHAWFADKSSNRHVLPVRGGH